MFRLFRKSALFLLPLALYVLLVAFIDPFSLFRIPHPFSAEAKENTAAAADNALYKFVKFRNEKPVNVLFGDSRMYAMETSEIEKFTHEPYFNFSILGASFQEIASAFWFAAKTSKLKNAYLGVNFLLYNGSNHKDRTTSALAVLENPLLYFCSYNVVKPTFDLIRSWGSQPPDRSRPKSSKDQFWHYVLFEETVPGYLHNYIYPENFDQELVRITEYCRMNNINLHFVIPPTHVDLQNRIADYRLTDAEARFKNHLRALAPTFDFEYPNELTRDKENFKDPMHYDKKTGKLIVSEIWGMKIRYCRYSTPEDSLAQVPVKLGQPN